MILFIDFDGVMSLAEGLLVKIADRVLTERKLELETLERDTSIEPMSVVSWLNWWVPDAGICGGAVRGISGRASTSQRSRSSNSGRRCLVRES